MLQLNHVNSPLQGAELLFGSFVAVLSFKVIYIHLLLNGFIQTIDQLTNALDLHLVLQDLLLPAFHASYLH